MYNPAIKLLLMGLATWRLSIMLMYEPGPFRLLLKGRERLDIVHDGEGPIGWPDTMPGVMFSCLGCMSIWIGACIFLLWKVAKPIVWVLALSGASNLIESRKE